MHNTLIHEYAMRSWLLHTCLIEALTSGIRSDSSEPDLRILISCSERCAAIKLNKLTTWQCESSAMHRFTKWQSLRPGSSHQNRLATPRCAVHEPPHPDCSGLQEGGRESEEMAGLGLLLGFLDGEGRTFSSSQAFCYVISVKAYNELFWGTFCHLI